MPDGSRERISGTPGYPGPYHDLPQSKVGAQEAERRAIATVMTGETWRPAAEPTKVVPTIAEYVDTFLDKYAAAHKPSSKRDKRQRLRAYILPALGHLRLDAVRQEDVDGLVAELLRRGLSRKTINNVTSVLSSLLKYAKKNRVIESLDLTFMIKAQQTEMVAVPAADVARLLMAAEDLRYRAGILLAADAGLRVGEIRALLWSNVNELTHEITVEVSYDRTNALTETKGWKRRTIPIGDRLWAALRALDRSKRHVFARLDGSDLALRYDGVREALQAIYVKAGVKAPPKPWHALRHTFCTELARAGVPVNVIKELAGHEEISTTLRYMHSDRDQKRDAISALRGIAAAPNREAKG